MKASIPEEDRAMFEHAAAGTLRLTKQQERDLFARYQNGDQDAGTLLDRSIRPWVTFLVNKNAFSRGWAHEELERESAVNLAIAETLHTFDPGKDCRLTTHSYWRARAVCARYTRFSGVIATPSDWNQTILNEESKQAVRRANRVRSINEQMPGVDDMTLGETIPDHNVIDPVEDGDIRIERLQLRWAIQQLDPKYAFVVQYRIVEGHTLEETAQAASPRITRERVRQIESKALEKLRYWIRLAPTTEAALVDSANAPLQLDGVLGYGRNVCEDWEPRAPLRVVGSEPAAEEDYLAATIRDTLRQISVEAIDKELQAIAESPATSIEAYQLDRKRLLGLRQLLMELAEKPVAEQAKPNLRTSNKGRLPDMFPKAGTVSDSLYKLLSDEGAMTKRAMAERIGATVSVVQAALDRYRDRFFETGSTYGKWVAIPRHRIKETWEALYGERAASA
jgi:RNA polymerase sigma factor (sigma-70 family)